MNLQHSRSINRRHYKTASSHRLAKVGGAMLARGQLSSQSDLQLLKVLVEFSIFCLKQSGALLIVLRQSEALPIVDSPMKQWGNVGNATDCS